MSNQLSSTALTRRIFVGTFLSRENKNVVAELLLSRNIAKLDGLRLVRPEKLHLTWLFLGDLKEAEIAEVKNNLKEILQNRGPVSLSFNRLTVFPDPSEPCALVLEPEKPEEKFLKLADVLRKNLASHCRKPDRKPFRPHITLARFPRAYAKTIPTQYDHPAISPFFTLLVNKICLIESHLGSSKTDYEIIETVILA